MKLIDLFNVLRESLETSTAEEIKNACALIVEVQGLLPAEKAVLECAFLRGPLHDGDVPSKSGRDSLIEKGYVVKVVVAGLDGYNACTHKGAWAYRLIKVGCDKTEPQKRVAAESHGCHGGEGATLPEQQHCA